MSEQRGTHFITYANATFMESATEYARTAREVGFETAEVKTRAELEATPFYQENRALLDTPRGNGYWLWKPYFIRETLRQLPEGDVLVYNDAGRGEGLRFMDRFPAHLCQLVREIPHGMICGFSPHIWHQARFTKRDAFIVMEMDTEEMYAASQITASWSLWRPTPEAFAFLDEWLKYGCDPRCISDDPSVLADQEFIDFQDHRHDQAIFSILVHKLRAPHLNLAELNDLRRHFSSVSRASGNVAQLPKRVSFHEQALANLAAERGYTLGQLGLCEMLGTCVTNAFPDRQDPLPLLKRVEKKPAPVLVQEAVGLSRTSPNDLTWEHIYNWLRQPDRKIASAHMHDKTEAYAEFVQASFKKFLVAEFNRGEFRRPNFQFFLEQHFDPAAFSEDPNLIYKRGFPADFGREELTAALLADPQSINWRQVWYVMNGDERKAWKALVASFPSGEIDNIKQKRIEMATDHTSADSFIQALLSSEKE